jgi:hypothetical protein
MKISDEKIKLIVLNVLLKDLTELKKIIQNIEVISIFAEKHGNRYKIRNKLDEILSTFLSEIELVFPLPAKKKLHKKLMNIPGFSIL